MKNKIFARCIFVDEETAITPEQHYEIIDSIGECYLIKDDWDDLMYLPKHWFGNTYTLIPGGRK